jgi:hypothetical protein
VDDYLRLGCSRGSIMSRSAATPVALAESRLSLRVLGLAKKLLQKILGTSESFGGFVRAGVSYRGLGSLRPDGGNGGAVR